MHVMSNDEGQSRTDAPHASGDGADASRKQDPVKDERDPKPEKGKDVKSLLKKAKRRGIAQKGQQGVIEFDYPRKKE